MAFVKKFQEGGVAPAPEAGVQQGGPEEQLMQMAQQILQQLGPDAAGMLAQIILEMLQSASAQTPQEQPQFARKGGKLVFQQVSAAPWRQVPGRAGGHAPVGSVSGATAKRVFYPLCRAVLEARQQGVRDCFRCHAL